MILVFYVYHIFNYALNLYSNLYFIYILIDRAISDAIENDRPNQYLIHSAEDYFGCIAKYQLLDEAPTVSKEIYSSLQCDCYYSYYIYIHTLWLPSSLSLCIYSFTDLSLYLLFHGHHPNRSPDHISRSLSTHSGHALAWRYRDIYSVVHACERRAGRSARSTA